jgi:mono/diheme cytochrome c family protein
MDVAARHAVLLPFMRSFRFSSVALLALLAALTAFVRAEESAAFPPEQIEFFEKKIRPVLVEHCAKCHSAQGEKIKGGLVIDSRDGLVKGGDTGPAVIPGNPEKSLIIAAIRYSDEDLQMPPKHRLSDQQIHDFEEWVRMGAPDPRTAAMADKPAIDFEKAKGFWSFQPVRDPMPATVKDSAWARNEIDAFLLTKLEASGLAPNPDADPRAFIRRATYDLTGLPPTPQEVAAFIAASSHDRQAANSDLIERLLASPAYGEKWGRHWLDLVRYADTSGCNSDFPVPSAYRYRNYVIDAFNRDKPYDQFLREQIAGDLLPPASEAERQERIVATGYLAIARRFGSRANEFHLTIEDLIDNLGKTALGLSVNCARCHDHKFDPITNRDYYALYGIFDSTKYAFPGTEIYPHTKDFVPLVADRAQSEKFMSDMDALAGLDDRVESLKNEKRKLEREEKKAAELAANAPVSEGDKAAPAQDSEAEPAAPKRTSADVVRELQEVKARQSELVKMSESLPKAYAVREGQPHDAKIQKKGDPKVLGDEVPRAWLTVLGGETLPPEEKGSGRRELAEWLTAPANPLTARVMVNRIWQFHFGKGLVKTPNDFGVRGEAPTHPELLDWLATRFIESGWSIKQMHRLIMLSRAYQMSASDREDGLAKDVSNDLHWKFDRRRLDAEEVRDSILAVADSLDRTPGERHPFRPESEYHYTQHKPYVDDYPTLKRAVYLMQQRIRKQPFLQTFDGADTNAPTAVRPLSTTPLQALWMMNDGLAHEQAGRFADRLMKEFSDDPARIQLAHDLAFARPAQPEEVAAAQDYLARVTEALAAADMPEPERPRAALASYARVLLSSNEFLFLE